MNAPRDLCTRLFAGDGPRFVARASQLLPLSGEQLRGLADRLDWGSLGANREVAWTEGLLAEFEDRLDWEALSRNRGAWWTSELIDAFRDRWSWGDLSRNPALPWSHELLGRYEARWRFAGATSLGRNEGLPWSPELVARYRDRWRFEDLSGNPGLPWTPALIGEYQDEWEWLALSRNPALPWSEELLATYPERWRWGRRGLSDNFGFPWSEDFLREHAERLDWQRGLSRNPGLPWCAALLEEHRARWLWGRGGLSGNPGLPWSPGFLEDHAERWDWKRLSSNEALPWSPELLERFWERWDRRTLQRNDIVFRVLLPGAEEFEVAYETIPDARPAEDLAPRPVAPKAVQARGRGLRRALGIKRVHASVLPWLQDAVRLDGPLVLLAYSRAVKSVTSMDRLFGRLGARPFPALRVGGDRFGVDFWLVPATGAVISLHHDATFFEVASDIQARSVSAFMEEFVARGSRLTWDQLLSLQQGARERAAAGEAPERAFGKALLAVTGWTAAELEGHLGHPALEFAREHLAGPG